MALPLPRRRVARARGDDCLSQSLQESRPLETEGDRDGRARLRLQSWKTWPREGRRGASVPEEAPHSQGLPLWARAGWCTFLLHVPPGTRGCRGPRGLSWKCPWPLFHLISRAQGRPKRAPSQLLDPFVGVHYPRLVAGF